MVSSASETLVNSGRVDKHSASTRKIGGGAGRYCRRRYHTQKMTTGFSSWIHNGDKKE
jgi:hypothetical protein